jgi:hypothetical protein
MIPSAAITVLLFTGCTTPKPVVQESHFPQYNQPQAAAKPKQSSTGTKQSPMDEAAFSTAERIKRQYRVEADPSSLSLSDLLDMEARLGTASRLKRAGLTVNYSDHSLSDLLDMEARIGTSQRIARSGRRVDWQTQSLSQLLNIESTLPTSRGRSSGYITSSSSPYTGSTSVPPIPTRASSYYGSDATVRNRAGGGYNIYNWKTGDDYTIKPKRDGKWNAYNWKTGDDYTIKPKGDGKWNAYNWKTGDDYDVKVRPGGRTEIYNWKTGEYIDAD